MEKRMTWIVVAVIGVIALIVGVALVTRYVNFKNAVPLEMELVRDDSYTASDVSTGNVSELIATVESDEEAQELAELYGITLKHVNNGLAVYETDEDPLSVIRRGEENGWKRLDKNTVYYFKGAK